TDDWFDSDGNWLHQKRPKDWGAIENYAERREIQKIIDACKQHLKILQQQVFVMKYMEDLNAEEICTLLKISNANYWVLLHRARLQMRDCVEKNLI
ncbi:sigma factor-like helix-turn-helix DNA-binding protein, partial [Streptomyces sp. UMAF16]|nr:sigma factor-like helix-turn-helix DNA-binding protein [Streptomyces sp. UMAF16]